MNVRAGLLIVPLVCCFGASGAAAFTVDQCVEGSRQRAASAKSQGQDSLLRDSQMRGFCDCTVRGAASLPTDATQQTVESLSANCLFKQLRQNPPRWSPADRDTYIPGCVDEFWKASPDLRGKLSDSAVGDLCECQLVILERMLTEAEMAAVAGSAPDAKTAMAATGQCKYVANPVH